MGKELNRSGQVNARRNGNDTSACFCAGSDRALYGVRLHLILSRNSTIFKNRYHMAIPYHHAPVPTRRRFHAQGVFFEAGFPEM